MGSTWCLVVSWCCLRVIGWCLLVSWGVWGVSWVCLGGVLWLSRGCLGGVVGSGNVLATLNKKVKSVCSTSGVCMGGVWGVSGCVWEVSEGVWVVSVGCLEVSRGLGDVSVMSGWCTVIV